MRPAMSTRHRNCCGQAVRFSGAQEARPQDGRGQPPFAGTAPRSFADEIMSCVKIEGAMGTGTSHRAY